MPLLPEEEETATLYEGIIESKTRDKQRAKEDLDGMDPHLVSVRKLVLLRIRRKIGRIMAEERTKIGRAAQNPIQDGRYQALHDLYNNFEEHFGNLSDG